MIEIIQDNEDARIANADRVIPAPIASEYQMVA
jgi:hypothetical protein